MPKFGTKNALFGYFWARFLEKLFSYLKSALSNLLICTRTQKYLNLGPKIPNLDILVLEFVIFVIFEISTFEFVSLQKYCWKTKMSKFGIKNALLGLEF